MCIFFDNSLKMTSKLVRRVEVVYLHVKYTHSIAIGRFNFFILVIVKYDKNIFRTIIILLFTKLVYF